MGKPLSSDQPLGPGAPFQSLLDVETRHGRSLPDAFQSIYGDDWPVPDPTADRPYTYSNFVTARDGRVSFNQPGWVGGGAISRFDRHDQWLMGLLRARADAIVVGDNTLRLEPDDVWTAEAIFPDDADAWRALRRSEGRSETPLQVFLSLDGNVSRESAVFSRPDLKVIVATTHDGTGQARAQLSGLPNVEVLDFGQESVDLARLTHHLLHERGVRALLCEGGPRVYGGMLAARQIDDDFLTLSPIFVGNDQQAEGRPRPSLVEGVAFGPESPPIERLVSVRRHGDYLYLHSRLARD